MSSLVANLDSHAFDPAVGLSPEQADRPDMVRSLPFLAIHVACFLVIWAGTSWWAVGLFFILYVARMFGITGGYHRYFSHRSYKLGRFSQFLLAFLANTSAQRGPLWWAAHHRHHHRSSDTVADSHSPRTKGWFRAHTTWFLTPAAFRTKMELVKDLSKFPELVFLDRFDWIAPVSQLLFCAGLGWALQVYAGADTSAFQLATWWCISTVAVMHATYTVNSACHIFGNQPNSVEDDSRNCWWAAILTLGEGWHNNHHHSPNYCQHSHRWWQFDPTYWIIWCGEKVGVVKTLKRLPAGHVGSEAIAVES